MAARFAFGFSFFAPRRRRTMAAFWLGAAISVGGLGVVAADRAGAHGPFVAADPTFAGARATYSVALAAAPTARTEIADAPPPQSKHVRERITIVAGGSDDVAAFNYVGSAPVCVRLCDGAFFPLPAAAGDAQTQTLTCGSLCPDAPTEVYYRNGSDRIEDAVSTAGRRYSALPVALRYRKTSDAACSCHRETVAYAPMRDATLRRGDAMMTPAGVVVFRGVEGGAHSSSDFTALANVAMSDNQRAALQEMERASVAKDHPNPQDWLVAQASAALAERRSPRGALLSQGENRGRLLVFRGGVED